MTANVKRLAYFDKWVDNIALEMLGKRPEIELIGATCKIVPARRISRPEEG